MSVRHYTVQGMTCAHCTRSVAEEVGELPAVTAVAVDLPTGTLTVTGEATPDAVREAVREAGYSLVA